MKWTYTVQEFADRAGISYQRASRMVREGQVKHVKFGRERRIPFWAVDELLGAPVAHPGVA